ncbi:unnamed protein product [Mesocestoides corti]|uniref:Protein kinase domain-containing protein n=1 Tax=Mesocestoides corti TaxID=53468 RepID=A0A0R3UIF9_MESCO|nr:unnamed protein product [Mesocestoides corti]
MDVDAFAVTERIHGGVCAQVLRAARKDDGLPVILKCYDAEHLESSMTAYVPSEGERPVLKEAYFLKKLQNVSGCVKMLDYFFDERNNIYVIVLEDLCAAGYSKLTQEIHKNDGFLTEASISWIMRDTIRTIQEFHSLNVLHCDIKPDNIFINRNERRIKLIDFNIAMELVPQEFPIPDARTLGCTPEYAPPEVLIRKCLWTPAGEVWSIGATAFVLLCKKFPFADPYSCHRMRPAYPENHEDSITDGCRYCEETNNKNSMPAPSLSLKAKDFLLSCLHKRPESRLNFQRLSGHAFLTISQPVARNLGTDSVSLSKHLSVSAKAS